MSFSTWAKKHWWQALLIMVSLIYISNLTAGIVELIPDNIPLAGNLDEGLAGSLLYIGLSNLFKR